MKKIITKYGLYSAFVMLVFGLVGLYFASHTTPDNYGGQMLFGYASIIVALVFIYFAIRHYRDNVNGGVVSFGKGLKLGLLISLFPSVVFGTLDTAYRFLNPNYLEHCAKVEREVLKRNTPPAEFEAKAAEIEKQMQFFNDYPVAGWAFMFVTVFTIGVIISVISALILQRKATVAN